MSFGAVDRDCKSRADIAHARFGQPANRADENCDRDALDRVEVDCRTLRDWIVTGFEDNFADNPTDIMEARWAAIVGPTAQDVRSPLAEILGVSSAQGADTPKGSAP